MSASDSRKLHTIIAKKTISAVTTLLTPFDTAYTTNEIHPMVIINMKKITTNSLISFFMDLRKLSIYIPPIVKEFQASIDSFDANTLH